MVSARLVAMFSVGVVAFTIFGISDMYKSGDTTSKEYKGTLSAFKAAAQDFCSKNEYDAMGCQICESAFVDGYEFDTDITFKCEDGSAVTLSMMESVAQYWIGGVTALMKKKCGGTLPITGVCPYYSHAFFAFRVIEHSVSEEFAGSAATHVEAGVLADLASVCAAVADTGYPETSMTAQACARVAQGTFSGVDSIDIGCTDGTVVTTTPNDVLATGKTIDTWAEAACEDHGGEVGSIEEAAGCPAAEACLKAADGCAAAQACAGVEGCASGLAECDEDDERRLGEGIMSDFLASEDDNDGTMFGFIEDDDAPERLLKADSKKEGGGLALLIKRGSLDSKKDELGERQLHWGCGKGRVRRRRRDGWGCSHHHNPHHHNPHHHNPHHHSALAFNSGSGWVLPGNRNNCHGRCGPGCTRWDWVCGSGAPFRGCFEHDGYCSCDSMTNARCYNVASARDPYPGGATQDCEPNVNTFVWYSTPWNGYDSCTAEMGSQMTSGRTGYTETSCGFGCGAARAGAAGVLALGAGAIMAAGF